MNRFETLESGRPSSSFKRYRVGVLLALVLLSGGLAGCSTVSPGSKDQPLIVLNFPGKTTESVGMTVLEVFKQAGYELKKAEKDKLEFLRPAGTMDQAIYGGLISGGVWERVRIRLRAEGQGDGLGNLRLELTAHKVTAPGDQVFEEAHRIGSAKRYEPLVAEIKKRVGG